MSDAADDLMKGHALHVAGKLEEAAVFYRRVLEREPKHPDALNLLGVVCLNTSQVEMGIELLRRCVELHPGFGPAWNNLGTGYKEQNRLEEAVAAYRRAIGLNAADAEAYNNLGIALKAMVRVDEAIAAYEQALRISPKFAEALNNLGAAYNALKRFDLAISCYRQALAIKPEYLKAHFNESAAQLIQGNWRIGWLKYEFRWASVQKTSRRGFSQPFWRGDFDLRDKAILLHAEQGLGDTIQFVRFLPAVARQARAVYLEVQPSLKAICEASFPEAAGVYAQGEALPAFDAFCPLLSLPHALHVELSTLPSEPSYLKVAPGLRSAWAERLGERRRPRIGFVWAGNFKNTDDRNRSISLSRFREILTAPHHDFFSLQKDRSEEDSRLLASMPGVVDLAPQITSFLDTAAIMQNLDLVVTVDTSVAHLAGALGVPVWIMIQYSPDWRWLLDRSDSPWYPSARLFRQSSLGDWAGVIADVTKAFGEFSRPD